MFLFSESKKDKLRRRELFYFLASLLLIFIILETVFPHIILAYFNLNYLFLVVVISGLIVLIKDGK